eukprot:EG_transcript_556
MLDPGAGTGARPSEFDRATMASRLTYRFVSPLMRLGTRQALGVADLYGVPATDTAAELHRRFAQHVRRGRSLWPALYGTFRGQFWATAGWTLSESACRMTVPLLLWYFVVWLQDSTAPLWVGAVVGGLMGLLTLVQVVVHHVFFFGTSRLGWNARTALTAFVHWRMLALKGTDVMRLTTGRLINLASNDVQRFDEAGIVVHYLWSGFVDLALVTVLLSWKLTVPSAFAGVAAMLALTPVQYFFGRRFIALRLRTAQCTDERVKLTAEIVHGIASIKAFTWEEPLQRRVEAIRRREERCIAHGQVLKAVNAAVYFASPVICSFVLFTVFWAQGQQLALSDVYFALALLYVLRSSVGMMWTRSVECLADVITSVRRLQELLDLGGDHPVPDLPPAPPRRPSGLPAGDPGPEELTDRAPLAHREAAPPEDGRAESAPTSANVSFCRSFNESPDGSLISAHAASFSWHDGDERPPVLRGVSFQLQRGQLLMVVGPVGCGKTSLLEAVLGELHTVAGTACLAPSVRLSYAAQQPWVRAASVQHNITLADLTPEEGEDAARFWRVVQACGLEADLQQWPRGEHTGVGEKGVNLSGGQRARLALARACYRPADVYLLDDPLSAVDPHVQHHIFHTCIRGLLADKAVVLVTHQVQFLEHADQVLVLDDNGAMLGCGPPAKLQAQLRDCLPSHAAPTALKPPSAAEATGMGEEEPADAESKGAEIVRAEERSIGKVTGATYLSYARNGGYALSAVTVAVCVGGQALLTFTDFYLRIWAGSPDQSDAGHVVLFGCLALGTLVVGVLRSWLFFAFALRAATSLHGRMFQAILHSPLWFFGANPSGRILNRFAKDQGQVDDLLPITFFTAVQSGLFCLSSIVLMVVSVPWLTLLLVPVIWAFARTRDTYLRTSRELKRVEAVAASPLLAEFGSNLAGLPSIRAAQLSSAVQRHFHHLVDQAGRGWFSGQLAARWFGFRLDMQAAFLLCMLLAMAVGLRQHLDPGLLGFAVMYGVNLSGLFQWTVRQTAVVENLMTSVERIAEYAALPSEEALRPIRCTDGAAPELASDWPTEGSIDVTDLRVRHREDLPFVLHGVSFQVKPGQRVGVVGRTGSGKSTLLLSLLQLTDAAEGAVAVDGVPLAALPLESGRRAMAYIPQAPVLFTGTLRFNLDPFDEYSDEELWDALDQAQMSSAVQQAGQGLAWHVAEGGGGLSTGQRQLVALARALLQRRRILLLDEATANVDYQTDEAVQRALRTAPQFRGCTVLTIAHRMSTVLDYDGVVVLDKGAVVEVGAPAELRQTPGSTFAAMVAAAGIRDDAGPPAVVSP